MKLYKLLLLFINLLAATACSLFMDVLDFAIIFQSIFQNMIKLQSILSTIDFIFTVLRIFIVDFSHSPSQ